MGLIPILAHHSLRRSGVATSENITPPAPTNLVVDDTLDAATFTNATGYTTSDHEYRWYTNGAFTAWTTATSNTIPVGDIAVAAGDLHVRVSAATGRNTSSILSNSEPFTIAVNEIVEGAVISSASFTATDNTLITAYTPETGPAFENRIGNMRIVGNAARTGTEDTYAGVLLDTKDVDYSFVLNVGPGATGTVMQIPVRWKDVSNHLIYVVETNGISLAKLYLNNYTTLGTKAAIAFTQGKIEIVAKGYELKFYVDDVLVRTDSDPEVFGSKVGVDIWPNTELLDFTVTSLVSDSYTSPVNQVNFWTDMHFAPRAFYRELLMHDPNGVERITANDGATLLGSPVDYGSTANVATQAYSGGKYTISTNGATASYFPVNPYVGAYKVITLDVNSVTYTGTPTKVVLGGMVAKDGLNFSGYGYDVLNNVGYFISEIEGALTEQSITPMFALTGILSKIHVAIGSHNLQMFLENTAGEIFYVGLRYQNYDYSKVTEQDLGLSVSAFVHTDATTATYSLNEVYYGTFGSTAHCNPRIVTYEDGSPYIVGNEVYFVQNGVMGGGMDGGDFTSWKDSCNAIYKYNIVTAAMTRVGNYTFTRPTLITSGTNYRHTSDGVSQLIYDRETSKFITVTQNMTDDGHTVFVCETNENLLAGGSFILPMKSYIPHEQLTISHYDPAIVKINGVYYITCVRSEEDGLLYHINRQTCYSSTDLLTFTFEWTDTLSEYTHEGSTIVRVDGKYLSLAPLIGQDKFRILDLADGSFIAEIEHPAPSNYATGHVAMFPVNEGGQTVYHVLTHDGNRESFRFGNYDFGNFVAFVSKRRLSFNEYQ